MLRIWLHCIFLFPFYSQTQQIVQNLLTWMIQLTLIFFLKYGFHELIGTKQTMETELKQGSTPPP